MSKSSDKSGQDQRLVRLIALCVFAAGVAYLVYANRSLLNPDEQAQADASLNPQFVACRDERVGQVEQMKKQGIINETQFEEFRERAVNLCAGQFPPDAQPQ